MARFNIGEEPSAYYPPRARWYGLFFYPWSWLRRTLQREEIRRPLGFSSAQVVLSLLLPGFSLFANRRILLGLLFVGLYLAALVSFVVWLGYPAGAAGYGLMISIHASSIVFLESCALRDKYNFGVRLPLALATLLMVWLAAYRPVTKYVETNWVFPMVVQGQVTIMKPWKPGHPVQRGDRLLYAMDHGGGGGHAGLWIQSGYGLGPVLAVAGDTVRFATNTFFINGKGRARLPHMPVSGDIVVPEKHWFIWPQLAISGRANPGEAVISSVLLQLALVPEKQFVGKPLEHWCWRKQILP